MLPCAPMGSQSDANAARLLAAVAAIPPGRVASYGEVAARAGLPGRARLVGRVLRDAPESARVPWHRIVRADGRLAFPAGSAAFREQARRLRAEGVAVRAGRVARPRPGAVLDEFLWAPR